MINMKDVVQTNQHLSNSVMLEKPKLNQTAAFLPVQMQFRQYVKDSKWFVDAVKTACGYIITNL